MDTLIFALNAVIPVLLLVVLGFALRRGGLLTGEFTRVANKLCYYVFLPTLMFCNIYKTSSLADIRYDVVGFSALGILALFLIGILLVRFIPDRGHKGAISQCMFRSNFAMYGLPLAISLAGDAGGRTAAALSVFSIPLFNVLAVYVLSRYSGTEEHKPDTGKIIKGIITNPLIIGCVCGFLALCIRMLFEKAGISFRLKDIKPLYDVLTQLSAIASPMSLIVLGAQFEFSAANKLKKQIALATFMRLVFAPLLVLGMAAVFLKDMGNGDWAGLIALFGSPVAVSSAILAREMKSDYVLASQLVVWTTLFSFISIFLIAILFRTLGML
ncbi:MAG TPA: AEC family transporter [Clostridia bacterium]|nr:AEC family transporter [Clostridia bacterium]